jgi:hypothetical protein
MKIIITFFTLSYLCGGLASSLNLKSGIYQCEYTYKNSDKEKDSSSVKLKYNSSSENHAFEIETEVTEANNPTPYLTYLPFLEFPKKSHAQLKKELVLGFDSIMINKYRESKRRLSIQYEFYGHWFTRTNDTVKIRKMKKERFKLSWKSKDLEGSFSSHTKLNCKLETSH